MAITVETMGKFEEQNKNWNGQRLTEFCVVKNLVIGNYIFKLQKESSDARWEKNKTRKNIIDFTLIHSKSVTNYYSWHPSNKKKMHHCCPSRRK